MELSTTVTCDVHELEQLVAIMEEPYAAEEGLCNGSLLNDDAREHFGLFNFSLSEFCSVLKSVVGNDQHVSGAAELALIVAYSVLIAAGLATNLAVSVVVARRALTPRNLYIVNLTLSDMSLCLVCMPFTLVTLLRRRWTLGAAMCKLVPALQGANIMVSTGTIAAIALDRYFSIVRRPPQQAAGTPTTARRTRVILSITAVWVLSALAALPLLFTQRIESFAVQRVVLYETCIESWQSRWGKLAYTVATLIVMYVIPIGVVAAVHLRIAAFLKTHATSQLTGGRAKREMARNRRITLLLSGVAVVFAVSWLPHNVLSVLVDASPNLISPHQLYVTTAACHVIAMSSAVSNPIIYGWFNTNIRREFLALLPACCVHKSRNKDAAKRRGDRNGIDLEALPLSTAAGLLGETTAGLDKRQKGICTTELLPPHQCRATVSTQLISEL